jgi:hypothetical protein
MLHLVARKKLLLGFKRLIQTLQFRERYALNMPRYHITTVRRSACICHTDRTARCTCRRPKTQEGPKSWFDCRQMQEMFSFLPVSREGRMPIQPLYKTHRGLFSWWVKRQESEADHSPPSDVEVKNERGAQGQVYFWPDPVAPFKPLGPVCRLLAKHRTKHSSISVHWKVLWNIIRAHFLHSAKGLMFRLEPAVRSE